MTTPNKATTTRAPHETPEKAPEEWTTGDEPMTGPQRSYLKTLCQEAGAEFDETLTKAEASKRIDELQRKDRAGRAAKLTPGGAARYVRRSVAYSATSFAQASSACARS